MKKNIKLIVSLILLITVVISIIVLLNILNTNKIEETSQLSESISNQNETETNKVIVSSEIHFSWDKDPSQIENLINENSYIVKIKIKNIGNAVMLDNEYGIDHTLPLTPINATIIEKISGDEIDENIEFYVLGGDIKISEKMKYMTEAEVEKMEFNKLSEDEKENSYINYSSESDYSMNTDEEYIVVLNKTIENKYYLSGNGYGIFKETENNGINAMSNKGISFTNVLTGKTFNY